MAFGNLFVDLASKQQTLSVSRRGLNLSRFCLEHMKLARSVSYESSDVGKCSDQDLEMSRL